MRRSRGVAHQAAREAAPWIERLARLGYASKGVVYAVIGILAFGAAFGRSDATDSSGAFLTILRQPLGTVILIVIAVGLLGYALWRLVQAIFDPESRGRGVKGLGYRGWLAGRGIFHLYFASEALRFVIRREGSEGGDAQHWLRRLLDQPFGQWLVILAGVAIGLYGVGQVIAAASGKFGKNLRLGSLEATRRKWVMGISRYGLAARGVVFAIVGWFILVAGWQQRPSHARDVGGALRLLENGPRGTWLLALVAVGLISYGLYELVKARYRRVKV